MKILILLIIIICGGKLFSQAIDDYFVETNGVINDIDSDSNYVYFGGQFTQVNKYSGCGVIFSKDSTSIDYNNKYKIYGTVNDAKPDGNGGWYICGNFTRIGDYQVGRFAHIFSDGSLDTTLLPYFEYQLYKIKIFGDDIFIIYGYSESGYLMKLNLKNGELNRIKTEVDNYKDIAIDEKYYYICGSTYPEPGDTHENDIICRVSKETGKIDKDFTIIEEYSKLCLLHKNYFYFVPYFYPALKRININTNKLDLDWEYKTLDYNNKIVDVKFDNNYLYITGNFNSLNNNFNYSNFARINLEKNELENELINFNIGSIKSLDIDSNFIYLAGNSPSEIYKIDKKTLNREENFKLTSTFNNSFNVINISNNNIFLGGDFSNLDKGITVENIFRYDKIKNEIDTNFNLKVRGFYDNYAITKIKVFENYLYLSGYFDKVNDNEIKYLAKYDLINSKIVDNFNLNLKSPIKSFECDESYLYIAGLFELENNIRNLARLNISNDLLDTTWNPNPNQIVNIIKIDENELYVGGKFDTIFNTNINYLAKLDIKNSKLFEDFNLGLKPIDKSSNIHGVNFIETDSKNIYITASLFDINKNPIHGFAKIEKDNFKITNLDTSRYLNIIDLAFKDDYLYCVGKFDYINDVKYEGIVKINAEDFIIDETWTPSLEQSTYFLSTIKTIDNYIYLGGGFRNISGHKRQRLVRFNDNNIKLETPKLISPSNFSYNIPFRTKFEFSKVKNSTKYDLIYYYKENIENLYKIQSKSNIYFNYPSFLEPSSTVYWKVRAKNEFAKSDWSEVFSFETRFLGPKFLQIENSNLIRLEYETDFVEWENMGGNFKYFLTFSDDFEANSRFIDSLMVSENKFSAKNLNDSTSYHLRVYALNGDKISSDSYIKVNVWYKKIPPKLNLLFPENNSIFYIENHFYFQWYINKDSEICHLQVSKDSLFSEIVLNHDSIKVEYDINKKTASFNKFALDSNTTYYWRVKAKNKLGESEFSDIWSFTTNEKFLNVDDSFVKQNPFSIYPNPANTLLNIVAKEKLGLFNKIEIFNLEGNLIIEKDGKFNNLSVDVSNIPVGTYIIKIHSNNTIYSDKFIKN